MREVFNIFDLNHSGYIEPYELKCALRAIGFDVRKSDVTGILETLRGEGNANKDLDFDEFKTVVTQMLAGRNTEDEIVRAFSLFDPHNTGKIGLPELRAVMNQLGDKKIKDDVLKQMIREFDTDGDGALSYDEYRAILVGQ